MRVRFQADADLIGYIISGVRRQIPEIDFKTASEAGLDGVPDNEVLARASAERRILVTHDRRTMPKYFAEFIAENECWGVVVAPKRLKLRIIIDELIMIWSAAEAEEFCNSIKFLPL